MSLGTFKSTTGAGIFQRLLLSAADRQFFHFSCYLLRIPGLQPESHFRNHKGLILNDTGTITVLHGTVIQLHDLSVTIDYRHSSHYLAHLPAIGSGIHHGSAADSAGNPRCEFQTGQTVLFCGLRYLAHQGSRLCLQACVLHFDPAHVFSDHQNDTPVTAIVY